MIATRSVLLLVLCAAAGCGARAVEAPGRAQPRRAETSRARSPASSALARDTRPPSLGTADPTLLLAAASDASWAAVCQARADTDRDGRIALRAGATGALLGDRARPYFVAGIGPGTPIDELLAFAPRGRYAAVRRGGRLLLMDASTGAETELASGTADLAADGLPFRQHRSVAFDRAGAHLLYVRRGPTHSEVVVRDLPSGGEHALDAGPGEVVRAAFADGTSWVLVHAVAEDTDGNGRLEWPTARLSANDAQCATANSRFPVSLPRGDVPRTRLAPANGTRFEEAPGFVAILGDGFVLRERSERLVWRAAAEAGEGDAGARSGAREIELAPAACAARIVYVDAARETLVVGCSSAGARWPLRLVARGYAAELGIDLAPTERLRPCEATPRLLALYPGQDTVLLDLERRVLVPLAAGDLVLCTHGKSALLQRARELWTFDVESNVRAFLAGNLAAQPDVLLSSPAVYVTPWVVDVRQGKVLGRFDAARPPLALAHSGRLLVWSSANPQANGADLPLGPLRWTEPRP